MYDIKLIDKTIENLKANNFDAFFVKDNEQAIKLIDTFIKKDNEVTFGGSMTLFETGVMDYLKSRNDIVLYDRNKEGNTQEDIVKIYKKAFTCDVYLTSTNAITTDGYLYNVDGNSNRISAMMYGPESVVVVTGYNKIVNNKEDAVLRVKNYVAPKNAQRLNAKTPCVATGRCHDCKSPERICCNYAFFGKQRVKNRIKVIIIGQEYGF